MLKGFALFIFFTLIHQRKPDPPLLCAVSAVSYCLEVLITIAINFG